MRIVMTLPWGERLGGAEEQLQILLEGAQDSGHEVELIFFRPGSWPDELRRLGLHVEVLDAGRLRQLHKWFATVARLARLFRARRPDLIINWSAKTQLYGAPAAVLVGMRRRVMWWQQAITARSVWLDRVATSLPAIAIGCNSSTAERAQAQLRPSRRLIMWYAGTRIPSSRATQPPLALPAGVPVVGLVGRLQPWKGQDRLLEAQRILRDRGHEMHLVLVGGDSYGLSPEYAKSLPELTTRLGLDGAVTMTGEVPDAGPYIEQLDVIVNASDPEPFGNVLVEGMARGVAAMGVNSGGPGEYLDHERTGMLARSGDPADLADALEPLLASRALREQIAEAGHELFLREFTEDAMRKRFFGSLEELMAKEREAAPHETVSAV
jgi:glycosyltransferase involved in cell wall biosynthesis